MTQRLLILTFVMAALLAAVPASAQLTQPRTRPERPTRGLFGGGTGNTSQQLVLNVSFGTGFDDDRLAAATGSTAPTTGQTPNTGQFGSGSASLNYTVDRSRVKGSLTAGTGARYFPGLKEPLLGTYTAGGQVSATLSSRTTLALSVQAGLQPYSLWVLFGNGFGAETAPEAPVDLGATTVNRMYTSVQTAVQFSQKLTRRLALNAGYGRYANDLGSGGAAGRSSAQNVQAGMSFELAKGLALRVGYGLSDASFDSTGSQARFRGRTIDGGIDFNRALSLTRRSKLAFSTGMVGLSDSTLKVRYTLTGHVNLTHELGRSWTLTSGYNRSANFSQTFGQPVLMDTASAGVGGQLGRRLQMSVSAGYSRGTIGIVSGSSGYASATAGSGLRLAITRELGLSVNYGYYRYLFDDGAPLPNGLAQEMDRQSVSVSLDLWAPLMTRARRPNAAR